MHFKIRGRIFTVERTDIEQAMQGVAPNPTDERHKYAVQINGLWYPIKQPVQVFTGLSPLEFTAGYAHRMLTRLGFSIHQMFGEGGGHPKAPSGRASRQPDQFLTLLVTLEQDEDGYFVSSCPAFAGCHSQGRTREEALANITEAARGYIASMRKHGEPVPILETVEIQVAA